MYTNGPWRRLAPPVALLLAPGVAASAGSEGDRELIWEGLIELRGQYTEPEDGRAESDLLLRAAELSATLGLGRPGYRASATLLYEEPEDEAGIVVDEAFVEAAPPQAPWRARAGRFFLPVGAYGTALVTDPLTLELGETGPEALEVGIGDETLGAAAYALNGGHTEGAERVDTWGAYLRGETAWGGVRLAGEGGWLSHLGASDGLSEIDKGSEAVGAWHAGVTVSYQAVTLQAEHVGATEPFAADAFSEAGEALEPTASRGELVVDWAPLAELPLETALGYEETSEAGMLDLPERRQSAVLAWQGLAPLELALEWRADEAPSGEKEQVLTGQVAAPL